MKEETFEGRGGTRIFMRSWRPATQPKAVVAICHGVNSHGGQHAWTAERLVEAGYAVYAIDLRGRGRSDGPRFFVDDIRGYTDDLGKMIAVAKAREPGCKVFLLGHSAGGVVSCTWALDHGREVAGFVCESFAFQVPAPAVVLAIVKFMSRFLPNLPVLTLHNRDFTRDPAALAALDADPLTRGEKQPAITVATLVRATERMRREFPSMTLPLLILHGTKDRATMHEGSRFFHATAGSKDKSLRLYEGHYHDLLNDIGKEAVFADIRAWLDARTV